MGKEKGSGWCHMMGKIWIHGDKGAQCRGQSLNKAHKYKSTGRASEAEILANRKMTSQRKGETGMLTFSQGGLFISS